MSRAADGLASGDLDRDIVLITATARTQTDSGEDQWDFAHATEETIPAIWFPAGTREAYFAQQRVASQVDGVFRIYDRNPRPKPDACRVRFDGRLFDLKPWIEIGRGRGLDLPAVARGEGE